MTAVSWSEFAAAEPALAAHAEQRLSGGICYFATVRPGGSPRVHPLGVDFRDGHAVVVMYPTSPKGHDLRRNGRYAVHCTVEDNNGGGGEVLVTGTATPTGTTQRDRDRGYVAFELLVAEVRATTYDTEQQRALSTRWKADDARHA